LEEFSNYFQKIIFNQGSAAPHENAARSPPAPLATPLGITVCAAMKIQERCLDQ